MDPVAEPSPEDAETLVLATLGDRFLGAFIDGMIFALLLIPSFVIMFFVRSFTNPGRLLPQMGMETLVGVGLLVFIFFISIQYLPLKQSGQTWGKRASGTKIITMGGERPAVTDLAFKRYAFFQLIGIIPVVGMIGSLVNILMIFRKDRRCLHDLIAGTQVVKVAPTPLA